jgi:hypothetical protein
MRPFILLLALLGFAATAEARHVRFLGPHPIAAKYGGGYCYLEVPHLHIYAPDHPALYQQVGDQYVFTGDPVPFGYDGDRFQYYGHHPVPGVDGVYCYIDGPHFHPYRFPETPEYKVQDNVAFYVAPLPEPYLRMKPQRERFVNEEYRPYERMRPQVVVQPPPEWHGTPYVAVGAPTPSVEVRGPGAVVAPPGVEVRGPDMEMRGPAVVAAPPGAYVAPPGVEVRGPGVEIRGPPPPAVVVAPPRPPGVYVAPPTPPGVVVVPPRPPGLVVGVPAPVVVAPAPGVIVGAPVRGDVYVEGHHDNGVRRHGDHDDQGENEGGHEHHDNGVRRHGGKR